MVITHRIGKYLGKHLIFHQDLLRRAEKIKNTKKKEVCGKYNNIKPDTSLKQAVHDPKDIIIPKGIVALEPLANLITKSN